jgi:hypothetical protein
MQHYVVKTKANPMTCRAWEKWTVEEDNNLIKELFSSKSLKDIAISHHRTVNGVRSRALMYAITAFNNTFEDINKVSKLFQISPKFLTRYIDSDDVKKVPLINVLAPWDEAQDKWLMSHIHKLTLTDIANKMRRSEIEISYHLGELFDGYPLVVISTMCKHTVTCEKLANMLRMDRSPITWV